jgi:hypothetical protein
MSVPLKATSYHTTERLLELALTMLDNARHEQNNNQLPANNWLTNNFTLEIIRAKVAANKANAIINVRCGAPQSALIPRVIASDRREPSRAFRWR